MSCIEIPGIERGFIIRDKGSCQEFVYCQMCYDDLPLLGFIRKILANEINRPCLHSSLIDILICKKGINNRFQISSH